jgi:methylase of polypeptide subunit release factors
LEAIDALLGELSVSVETRASAIALEVGEGQAHTVADLVRRAEFTGIEVRKDLAGIERVVVGHAEGRG